MHWAENGYGMPGRDEHGLAAARVLASMAAAGNTQPLVEHVRTYIRQSPRALAELLHNLAITFTHHSGLRVALPSIWTPVMAAALEEMEAAASAPFDRHWSPVGLAGLVPAPEPDLSDPDPDTTIEHARHAWPDPEAFSELISRWLAIARGLPETADAVVKLARCAHPDWQANVGLRWVEDVINGRFASVAGRCYYLTWWLGDIRPVVADGLDAARWHRLVDGLATAAGDLSAARLQQAAE